jgi:hypothetical protein
MVVRVQRGEEEDLAGSARKGKIDRKEEVKQAEDAR